MNLKTEFDELSMNGENAKPNDGKSCFRQNVNGRYTRSHAAERASRHIEIRGIYVARAGSVEAMSIAD